MTDDVVNFTDDIRVPRIDPTSNGYPVDAADVVRDGTTYKRQRVGICGHNPASGASEDIWKDAYTGAIVQIEVPHAAIHLGKYFSHTGVISLASDASYDHLIITPDAVGKTIHLRLFTISATSAPLQHLLYEDCTVSATGVAQTGHNFNRNSANATLGLYHDPTVTTIGSLIHTAGVVGSGKQGGAGQTSGTEWLLKHNASYLSRITNASGGIATIMYAMEWYEL